MYRSKQRSCRVATGGKGPEKCIDAVGLEAHATGSVDSMYDRAKQAMMLEDTLDDRLFVGLPGSGELTFSLVFPDGSGPGLMSQDHRTVQPPDFCAASLSILLVTLVVSVLIDIPLTALFAQVAAFRRPIVALVNFGIGSRTFRATLFRGTGGSLLIETSLCLINGRSRPFLPIRASVFRTD